MLKKTTASLVSLLVVTVVSGLKPVFAADTSTIAAVPSSSPATAAVPSAPPSSVSGQPHVIAHRGGTNWAPENTLSAFRKAIEAGAYGIELDIHRCKTGQLVVIHDETLNRTTNGIGYIKDTTIDDIKKLSAGSWYSSKFANEKVPLLSEVLDLVNGKVEINIEIKNAPIAYPGIEDDLIALLSTYKFPDKINIISFDHQVLQKLHKKAPQYKIGLLCSSILADIGDYARITGATAWDPSFDAARPDAVQDAHAHSIQVYVWTVDHPEDWGNMCKAGVDEIITNKPSHLMDYLKQHKAE
jgi:glycerophosphoryl diester phosphodiesterase